MIFKFSRFFTVEEKKLINVLFLMLINFVKLVLQFPQQISAKKEESPTRSKSYHLAAIL